MNAIAGADATGMQASADFILENMSGRMADALREEVEDRGPVKGADVEDAMAAIVQSIRDLEASGELLLIVEDGETD